ncbi:MAG: dihydrofolate synthase [Bacteroidetes bacterium]|nr:dihydrofolate synthase [Bacteroidota bacterium]
MNYKETTEYLFNQLPMYQRIGKAAYKTDLKNTLELCKLLDHPHKRFKSIHIAGTNGKGSTAHFLASIFQTAGFKTGLYTSPHLKDFRERIKINGEMISEDYVVEFVKKNKKEFEKIQLSFFEMTVGLAFQYFADEEVDIAIIETGMGGRLDSTNVIDPVLSVITNIGFDHMQFLGDTLPKIAAEKAEIIKKNTPVVIGETQSEIQELFIQKADSVNAEITFADDIFELKKLSHKALDVACFDVWKNNELYIEELESPLLGEYQAKNIATALQAADVIKNQFGLSHNIITDGIRDMASNTGFRGRWQILSKNPLTICDTAHNKEGIKEVVSQLRQLNYDQLHFVLGMVNDKNIDQLLRLLPHEATYYFCKADIPRGLPEKELKMAAHEVGLRGRRHSSVREAYNVALNNAGTNDLIFIGGSTFVVAEIV